MENLNLGVTDIDQLVEMWNADSLMDITELAEEAGKMNKLHAKYIKILVHHRKEAKKSGILYDKAKKLKWRYYNSELNEDTEFLTKHKWEKFLYKLNKDEVATFLAADKDLINGLDAKEKHEHIVEFCEGVIDQLKTRSFSIRQAIDWQVFTQGMK